MSTTAPIDVTSPVPSSLREDSKTSTRLDRYPGPHPFRDTPEDCLVFFGRETQSEMLSLRIQAARLLLLFGKSGLGKTSLLQAGVFPKLREVQLLPILVRLSEPVKEAAGKEEKQVEGHELLDLVKDAARIATRHIPDLEYVPGEGSSLWEFLKTAMFWQGELLMTPVLVFDQFEELFTLRDQTFRTFFAQEVGAVVSGNVPKALRRRGDLNDRPPNVRIVFAFKEEFLAHLIELNSDIPRLLQEYCRLVGLSDKDARKAIRKPAALSVSDIVYDPHVQFASPSFEYDEEALGEIVSVVKARSETIEPFQLQLICRRAETIVNSLASHQTITALIPETPHTITLGLLGGRAGIESIIQDFYTDEIGKLQVSCGQKSKAKELCEAGLLSNEGNRVPMTKDRIINDYGIESGTLQKLVDARLLRTEPRHDTQLYELSHDALARSIYKNRRWRIPRRFYLPIGVGIAAVIVILSLWVVFTYRITTKASELEIAKSQAEDLIGFLIGDQLLEKIRPIGRTQVFKDVHEKVEEYMKRIPRQKSPASYRNLGLTKRNEGNLLVAGGNLSAARKAYVEAEFVFSHPLSGVGIEPQDWQRELATTWVKLAKVLKDQGKLNEATGLQEKALTVRANLFNAGVINDPERLKGELAESHVEVGLALSSRGDLAGAIGHFDETIQLANSELAGRPREARWLRLMHEGLDGRGSIKELQGDLWGAKDDYVKSKEHVETLVKDNPLDANDRYRHAIAINKIANYMMQDMQFDKALVEYQRINKSFEELTRWDEGNRSWQRDRAMTLSMVAVANSEWGLGDYDKSLDDIQLAIKEFEELTSSDPSNMSWLSDLSLLYKDAGRMLIGRSHIEDGLKYLRNSVSLAKQIVKQDPDNIDYRYGLVDSHINLGSALILNDPRKGGEHLAAAQTLLRDLGSTRTRVPGQYITLGSINLREGDMLLYSDMDAALLAYRSAVNSIKKAIVLQPENPQYQVWLYLAHRHVGDALERKGDLNGALATYREGIEALNKAQNSDPNQAVGVPVIDSRKQKGQFEGTGHPVASRKTMKESKRSPEQLGGPTRVGISHDKRITKSPTGGQYQDYIYEGQSRVGNVLTKLDRNDEAIAAHQKAAEALKHRN